MALAPSGEVRIEIGELDLTGVPPARRFVVAASFERELGRLVALHGAPDGVGDRDVRHAPPLGTRLTANPVLVGHALARSVYEALR